jgi:hypothetical protein
MECERVMAGGDMVRIIKGSLDVQEMAALVTVLAAVFDEGSGQPHGARRHVPHRPTWRPAAAHWDAGWRQL